MKKTASFCLVILFSAFILLLLLTIYPRIDENTRSDSLNMGSNYYLNIDTYSKQWLNGYLGIFFRFKYFGNIIWIIFLIFICLLFSKKRMERGEIAVWFVFGLTVLTVGIWGGGRWGFVNWRYQLTLFPFAVYLIVLYTKKFIENRSILLKFYVVFFLLAMIGYNFFHYYESYKSPMEYRISLLDNPYPTQVLSFINSMEIQNSQTKILVCSPHTFYYYSNKKGIDYYSSPNYRKMNRKKLYDYVKNELNLDYIYSNWTFEQYYKDLGICEFIDLDSRQLVEDRGYRLYKIRGKPIEEALKSESFSEFQVWDSRSVPAKNTSPKLHIQGIRGKFSIDYKKPEDQNLLNIHNQEASEKKERILQLGYTLDKKAIDSFSLTSKYIYFLVSIKIPYHLINKNNYIFIQDFNGKWERRKVFFARDSWREYLIKKKIRPETTEVGIGFKFQPQSQKDEIQIKDIKIYFLAEEI